MSSKHLKTDFVYALPSAEIAVMGPESACNIIFAKEIRDAENPEALRQQKINEYHKRYISALRSCSLDSDFAVIIDKIYEDGFKDGESDGLIDMALEYQSHI